MRCPRTTRSPCESYSLRPQIRLEHRGLRLLALQHQSILLVGGHQQADPGARAHASDAHHLAGDVDDRVGADQVAAFGIEARHVLVEQCAHVLHTHLAQVDEVAQRLEQRGHADELRLSVHELGQPLDRASAGLAPALGERVHELRPAVAPEALAEPRRDLVGRESRIPRLERAQLGELPHRHAVLPHRLGDDLAALGAGQLDVAAGDLDARRHPLDVPLPRPGQRLVEVVQAKQQVPVGSREASEVGDVGIAAHLHHDPRVRCRGQVGGHHRGRASVEGKRRGEHAPVADGHERLVARFGLGLENRHRIGPIRGRRPRGVALARHVAARLPAVL